MVAGARRTLVALAVTLGCASAFTFGCATLVGIDGDYAVAPTDGATDSAIDAADAPSDGPSDVRPQGPLRAVAIAAGGDHACAILLDGTIACWGQNTVAQLGIGTANEVQAPVAPAGVANPRAIAAGFEHSCAIAGDETAYCWGKNDDARLGTDAGQAKTNVPAPVTVPPGNFFAITAGGAHTCALTSAPALVTDSGADSGRNGSVVCFGDNAQQQLGSAGTDAGLAATALAAGNDYTCAIAADQRLVTCWGANQYGQLGDGNTGGSRANAKVPNGLGSKSAVSIASGSNHTCAAFQDGELDCWGNNTGGKLGVNDTGPRTSPTRVLLDAGAVAVAVGDNHTCAITAAGDGFCWGQNGEGQIGNGADSGTDEKLPSRVRFDGGLSAIAAHDNFTCAIASDKTVWCWGSNLEGQLGNRALDGGSSVPVQVAW